MKMSIQRITILLAYSFIASSLSIHCIFAAPTQGQRSGRPLANSTSLSGVLSDDPSDPDAPVDTQVPSESQGSEDVESDNDVFETIGAADAPVESDDPTPEFGEYFEGDITSIDPSLDQDALEDNVRKNSRWDGGKIPFVIGKSHFSNDQMAQIKKAMQEYHAKTCIRWVPRTKEVDYVIFQSNKPGCFSSVGRSGGAQVINYERGCFQFGTLVHEMMHAVGFYHEQSRSDRDQFVTIFLANVIPGMEGNFNKYTDAETVHLGAKYDYGSVMHYTKDAFAADRTKPTMVAKDPNAIMGQRKGFSVTDLFKINKLYNCK